MGMQVKNMGKLRFGARGHQRGRGAWDDTRGSFEIYPSRDVYPMAMINSTSVFICQCTAVIREVTHMSKISQTSAGKFFWWPRRLMDNRTKNEIKCPQNNKNTNLIHEKDHNNKSFMKHRGILKSEGICVSLSGQGELPCSFGLQTSILLAKLQKHICGFVQQHKSSIAYQNDRLF